MGVPPFGRTASVSVCRRSPASRDLIHRLVPRPGMAEFRIIDHDGMTIEMKSERCPADIPRREFLKSSSLLAILATITIKVVGCDGEKDEVVSVEATTTPQDSLPNQQSTASSPTSNVPEESAADPPPSSDPPPEDPAAKPTPRPPRPRPTPDPTPDPMPMMCRNISSSSTIDFGHDHSYTLTAAAQEAGAPISLTLNCAGGHKHSVRLSGSEVTSICAGAMVVKESSFDANHTHSVMFNV